MIALKFCYKCPAELSDIVQQASIQDNYDLSNPLLKDKLYFIAKRMKLKAGTYIGYEPPFTLTDILAEMVVKEYAKFRDMPDNEEPSVKMVDETLPVKKIVRGDYSVEYDTSSLKGGSESNPTSTDIFSDYEWILKKYKKLKVL